VQHQDIIEIYTCSDVLVLDPSFMKRKNIQGNAEPMIEQELNLAGDGSTKQRRVSFKENIKKVVRQLANLQHI
jgi:hypothetical protein